METTRPEQASLTFLNCNCKLKTVFQFLICKVNRK